MQPQRFQMYCVGRKHPCKHLFALKQDVWDSIRKPGDPPERQDHDPPDKETMILCLDCVNERMKEMLGRGLTPSDIDRNPPARVLNRHQGSIAAQQVGVWFNNPQLTDELTNAWTTNPNPIHGGRPMSPNHFSLYYLSHPTQQISVWGWTEIPWPQPDITAAAVFLKHHFEGCPPVLPSDGRQVFSDIRSNVYRTQSQPEMALIELFENAKPDIFVAICKVVRNVGSR